MIIPHQQTAKKLQFIDTLRGIAVLLVLLVHTSQVVDNLPPLSQTIAGLGKLGVQLFFILSAYTLCMSVSRRKEESNSLLFFYIRRFFRVAPLYYVGIALYGLCNLVIGADTNYFSLKNILANVFFVHGFYMPANNNIVPGGWSIGTEMAFYAVFPFIFYFYGQRVRSWAGILLSPLIGLVGCLCLTQLLLYTSNYSLNEESFLYFNLFNQLPVFLLGISYYCFIQKYADYSLPKKLVVLAAVCYAVVLISGFILFRDNITIKPFIAGLAFMVLVQAVRNIKLLNIGLLTRIGQLSYSMYLFHFIFAWHLSRELAAVLGPHLDSQVILLLCYGTTIVTTMAVAVVSERTIERYGIVIGAKLIARLRVAPEPLVEAKA